MPKSKANVILSLKAAPNHSLAEQHIDPDPDLISTTTTIIPIAIQKMDLKLKSFSMTEQQLRTISNLTHLTKLSLSNTHLPHNLDFSKLVKIESFSADNCSLSIFPILTGPQLRTLSLNYNYINDIPPNIGDLFPNLEHFSFSYNYRTVTLPHSLQKCTKLISLQLAKVQLEEVPEWFSKFPNLEKLSLFENSISELPESMKTLSQLRNLDLGYSYLYRLPEWFGDAFPLLDRLNLQSACSSPFPSSFANLHNLTYLKVSSCLKNKISYTIGLLPKLEILDLDCAGHDHLPESLGKSTSIKSISSWRNRIQTVPIISSLESINFIDNKMDHFPLNLCSCLKLKSLNFAHNDISIIPNEISALKQLQDLNLAYNQVKSLPDSIFSFRHLRGLNLSHNHLFPTNSIEILKSKLSKTYETQGRRWPCIIRDKMCGLNSHLECTDKKCRKR